MKVKDAAKLLNKSEMWVRCGLRAGKLPFGTAVKTSSRWSYHISDNKLYEYLGKEGDYGKS